MTKLALHFCVDSGSLMLCHYNYYHYFTANVSAHLLLTDACWGAHAGVPMLGCPALFFSQNLCLFLYVLILKTEWVLSFTDKGGKNSSQVFLCRKGTLTLDTCILLRMYYHLWDKGTHHVRGQKKPLVRSSDFLRQIFENFH